MRARRPEAQGRLSQVAQGDRQITKTYDAAGYPAILTDPLGRQTSSSYDAAGRVTTQTLPDGRQIHFAYDANGNLVSLTPPSRPAHGFGWDETDRPEETTAPEVGGVTPVTRLEYNLDHQVTRVLRPDGQAIENLYDALTGRLVQTSTPRGFFIPTYHPVSGQVTSVVGPGGEGLAFTYDGSLPKSVTWSGVVTGSISYDYNSFLEVSESTIAAGSGSKTISYSTNRDGQLTTVSAGPAANLSLTYDPVTGFSTGSTLGVTNDSATYSSFG